MTPELREAIYRAAVKQIEMDGLGVWSDSKQVVVDPPLKFDRLRGMLVYS